MSIANQRDGNQAQVTTGQITEEQFGKQLDDLTEQWKNARDTDLEIRHRTGALLNERFGNPAKRLPRGREILAGVADQLQVAQSELSRMRRFAFHFKSTQDLKQTHPDATNWTAVKGLLPTLMPKGDQKGQAKQGAKSPKPDVLIARKVKKLTQLLDTLPTQFREIEKDHLTEQDRRSLQAKFELVAEVVGDCLKKASVSQDDELHSQETAAFAETTA